MLKTIIFYLVRIIILLSGTSQSAHPKLIFFWSLWNIKMTGFV